MYVVTAGGVQDIIDWFNKPMTAERLLCFLVTKTHQDKDLLEQLFDDRGRVSARLGPEVALFLFSNETARSRELIGLESRLIIPGLARQSPGAQRRLGGEESWVPMSIDMVEARDRDSVVQRSLSVAYELCSYFDLGQESLPCVMILTKDNSVPFVVRTRNAADIKSLEDLLAELRELAQVLTVSGMLDLPFSYARLRQLVEQKEEIDSECEAERRVLVDAIRSAKIVFESLGLGRYLDDLDEGSAPKVFEQLGMNRSPHIANRQDDSERVQIEAALLDAETHRSLRKVKNVGRKLKRLQSEFATLNAQIDDSLSNRLNPRRIEDQLFTTEKRLDEICDRFERRFRWRRYVLPLKVFVRHATGAAKAASDATSVVSSLDKLANEMIR